MPKININGITREMTEEEINESNVFVPSDIDKTTDEKLSDLDIKLSEISDSIKTLIDLFANNEINSNIVRNSGK